MGNLEAAIEKRFRDQSVELEVVAYAIKNPVVSHTIDPEWLASTPLSNIIRVLRGVNGKLTRAALFRELKQKKYVGSDDEVYTEFLDQVFDIDVSGIDAQGMKHTISNLAEMAESRRILYGMREIASSVKSDFSLREVKEKLRDLGRVMENVLDDGKDYCSGFEDRVEIVRERGNVDEDSFVGIPTGIDTFDKMCGGLVPTEFGVVVGRPGIGKTVTLSAFAVAAWQADKNVLFVTGEMPKLDIELRIDSMLSGVSASNFRFGNLTESDLETWKRAIENERVRRENFLEVVSFSRGFDVAAIEDRALRLQDKHKKRIDLICIDYLNIMSSKKVLKGRSSRSWDSQADVVWELKELVSDLNGGISGWTAGQITDDAVDSDVLSLSDVKYSRSISETSPIVVGLVSVYSEDIDHTMELQILKMRNMPLPSKSIVLRPNMDRMCIHEEVLGVKDLLLLESSVTPKRFKKKPLKRKG